MVRRLIVHVSLEYTGSAWGGITSALELLVAASIAAGQPVAVLTLGMSDAAIPLGPDAMLYRVRLPLLGVPAPGAPPDRIERCRLASERFADVLADVCAGSQADMCVHNPELLRLVELTASANWRRRSAAFVHGLALQEHPGWTELQRMQADLLAHVDAAAVFAQAFARLVRSAHPQARRVQVVRLPLARLAEQAAARPPRQLAGVLRGTLFSAGRSVPQKGFDILLRALALLPAGTVDAMRMAIGHGDPAYQRAFLSAARQSPARVLRSTWMSRDDLSCAMRTAGALVVPSRFEPFGLVAAEALAQGIPVVASAVGGLPELVATPELGWLVPSAEGEGPSPEALAAVLAEAAASAPAVSPGPDYLAQWRTEQCIEDLRELLDT